MSNNISPAHPAPTMAAADPLAAVAGRSGWIVSDGKAGNDTQLQAAEAYLNR